MADPGAFRQFIDAVLFVNGEPVGKVLDIHMHTTVAGSTDEVVFSLWDLEYSFSIEGTYTEYWRVQMYLVKKKARGRRRWERRYARGKAK